MPIFKRLKLKLQTFPRLVKKPASETRKQPGSPPGTLIHAGERKVEEAKLNAIEFDHDCFHEFNDFKTRQFELLKSDNRLTWIQITGLHDVEKISQIGKLFDVHPLVLEDVLNTHGRSKIELGDNYIFIVTSLLSSAEGSEEIERQHFSMLILPHTVITFVEHPTHIFDVLHERISASRGRIRESKEDYLAWTVLDAIIDNYFCVIDVMNARLGDLDAQLQDDSESVDTRLLFSTKREITELHRLVRPIREIAAALQRGDSELLTEQSKPYFGDLYDHAIHAIESIEMRARDGIRPEGFSPLRHQQPHE